MKIIGDTPCERKLSLAQIVADSLVEQGYDAQVLRNVDNVDNSHRDYCLVHSKELGTIHVTAQGELRSNSYVELDFGKGDQNFTKGKDYFAIGYNALDRTNRTFVLVLKAEHIVAKPRITLAEVKKLSERHLNIILSGE